MAGTANIDSKLLGLIMRLWKNDETDTSKSV
jgi:hypothetical protein